jgi:hypothetical protein
VRIAPRIISSNAEVLTDDILDLGRRVWGVTVLNRYATIIRQLLVRFPRQHDSRQMSVR